MTSGPGLTGEGPHQGNWQMRGHKERLTFAEGIKPLPWQNLAARYGPLTDLPATGTGSATKILEAVVGAAVATDDKHRQTTPRTSRTG
ncbi:hypothetical protein [Streptomyces niveus]|uniref:hypothetical protein n=1 Tax=Streptomyces niveus TaxID=193462 RepID=UPI0036899A11